VPVLRADTGPGLPGAHLVPALLRMDSTSGAACLRDRSGFVSSQGAARSYRRAAAPSTQPIHGHQPLAAVTTRRGASSGSRCWPRSRRASSAAPLSGRISTTSTATRGTGRGRTCAGCVTPAIRSTRARRRRRDSTCRDGRTVGPRHRRRHRWGSHEPTHSGGASPICGAGPGDRSHTFVSLNPDIVHRRHHATT
jgi:hypothetical protein